MESGKLCCKTYKPLFSVGQSSPFQPQFGLPIGGVDVPLGQYIATLGRKFVLPTLKYKSITF